MENKIKKSYSKIKMSTDARERIYEQITGSAEQQQIDQEKSWFKKLFTSGWKISLASCLGLVLLLSTGAYAAEKISDYFTVNIKKENYQAEIDLHKSNDLSEASARLEIRSKTPDKYISVKADFGDEYLADDKAESYEVDQSGKITAKKEQIKEGTDGMYCYSHRDGFDAGKDFYYNVLYMDESEDCILKLYSQTSMKEITVNDHRAFLCKALDVKGTRYASDHDTDYNIDLYVFYEEYGYIINFCGMQRLGQEKLLSLAEKAVVTETIKKEASRYEYLSQYKKASTLTPPGETAEIVTAPVKNINEQVTDDGLVCQVKDVKITSNMTKSELVKTDSEKISDRLFDKNGTLKPYARETIKNGDGISTPEYSVSGISQTQLSVVHVTMQVRAREASTFCLPEIAFYEKENGKYYNTHRYRKYNRPEYVEDALMDLMPCYFKETSGGKQFYLKEMKKGEEQTYHFAYIVDEDMTDSMQLCFGDIAQTSQYIDISQQQTQ